MTRFVPMTHRDGTNLAIDAHRVTDIVEMPDGFVRGWPGEEHSYEIPGTVAQISALLSDPPAVAVRFVKIGNLYVNPARVAFVEPDEHDESDSLINFSATVDPEEPYGDYVFGAGLAADVIAKLEGRAL